jgi:hypothetical protein
VVDVDGLLPTFERLRLPKVNVPRLRSVFEDLPNHRVVVNAAVGRIHLNMVVGRNSGDLDLTLRRRYKVFVLHFHLHRPGERQKCVDKRTIRIKREWVWRLRVRLCVDEIRGGTRRFVLFNVASTPLYAPTSNLDIAPQP